MGDQTTLVATLGGQPQIVTFTLDLLLAQGETIDQVVVVYLASGSRYREAYQRLSGEFIADRYANRTCHLRGEAVREGVSSPMPTSGQTLADVITPNEVEAVRRKFHHLLADLKEQGHLIHLSLSGGRRVMALIALSAAMQYLTPMDSVWHIYTPPDLTEQAWEGAVMHAPSDSGLRLVPVPFVPWAAYFPGLAPLLSSSPQEMREAGLTWLSEAERERCRQVWDSLTPRQRDALRAFANGMGRQQAASCLKVSVYTVDDHRDVILRRCREAWGAEHDGDFDTSCEAVFGPSCEVWVRCSFVVG
ncbi:MAG: histidine kinase [Chloroflexi bacterium]|nr:histidine kinase [Chloroflexota bacterium]